MARGTIRRATALACLAAAIVAAAGAGCGSSSAPDRPEKPATLVLDFAPNAVHAGIELAVDRDYDGAEGVDLRVQAPSSSTDAVKLLTSGRVQFAVLDIHDLALARARARDLVGVMAVVQRPLAAVLAQPRIRRPRDLVGRRVGVTGVPSDEAVLRAIVDGDGGNGRDVEEVTIGFQAVSALLSRRVDGATAFWNVEGLALQRRRPGAHVFRLEDYGAPPYPELVLATTRQFLDEEPSVVRATVRALRRGYEEALNDPDSAVSVLVDKGAGRFADVRRQLEAVQGAFTEGAPRYGAFDRAALEKWATWEAANGLVDSPPDVKRAFAFGF